MHDEVFECTKYTVWSGRVDTKKNETKQKNAQLKETVSYFDVKKTKKFQLKFNSRL